MRILWSDNALIQLQLIFDYYYFTAGELVAGQIVNAIIDKSLLLSSYPFLGSRETLLSYKSLEYRFIIEKNYKIIYRIDDTFLFVVSVFDCRQDPIRIGDFEG